MINADYIKIGQSDIDYVFAGQEKIWPVQPPTPSYENQYLTFEATSGTCRILFTKYSSAGTLSYSIDDGSTWEAYGAGIVISTGERALFKGDFKDEDGQLGYFAVTDNGTCDVYGNIMSILYSDDFADKTSLAGQRIFQSFFGSNGCLINAENLVLPATELSNYCYHQMFLNCSKLTTAPSSLPATTLAENCYASMFGSCRSLISAPSLPATTLASGCYSLMFNNCSKLATAPVLPATRLVYSCYLSMFKNCISLKEVTCLATDISASISTYEWVSGVSATGTFIKNPSMTSWTTGNNGIPVNWTVVDYSS